MSDWKLKSDEVPNKFAEWLLAMGCPTEKVPLVDKILIMCRGQYYIVWRSLMEHVKSKDVIQHKRLQVFCDDIRQCQKKNIFYENNTCPVVSQLSLWQQQVNAKQKVEAAKDRVVIAQQDLSQLVDTITSKIYRRNLSLRRMEVVRRRAWLLQQIAEELRAKLDNLRETRAIAHSFCAIDDDGDIQSTLDKCIGSLRRQAVHPSTSASVSQLSVANPAASSSVVSAIGEQTDFEEQLQVLVKCRGDALCSQLYERRAGLVPALSAGGAGAGAAGKRPRQTVSPKDVLARTFALHIKLTLEATKNRKHLNQARRRLVAALGDLSLGWPAFGKLRHILTSKIPQCLKTKVFNQCVLPVMTYGAETWTLTVGLVHRFKVAQRATERTMLGISLLDQIRNEEIRQRTKTHRTAELRELLVVSCEKVHAQVRVDGLRALLDELQARRGVFEGGEPTDEQGAAACSVAVLNRAIESKKAELNRVIVALAALARKLQGVRDSLATVFNAFPTNSLHNGNHTYKANSMASLHRFYEARRERRRGRVELSLEMDVSDCSYSDAIDKSNPRFIDELRIYLKKFNLEKNRKLILESGKKIWIFETVEESVSRLHTRWLSKDLPCSLVCPARSAVSSVQRVMELARVRAELEAIPARDPRPADVIETNLQIEEEEIIDRIKKRLNENLLSLQKNNKTLDLGKRDLKLWSENSYRSYISTHRIVNGMTYKGYEIYYLENCMNV